jgi:hypothetical protein
MYKDFNGPCKYFGAPLQDGATALGQIQWLVRLYSRFLIFPHKRSLRDFPESPSLFEELLPFLLVIRALKGRAVVLESTGVAGPAEGAMFWEVELAVG